MSEGTSSVWLAPRVVVAVVLPAVLVVGAYSADDDSGVWILFGTPIAWLVLIVLGRLDGFRVVVGVAILAGVLCAAAAEVERDPRDLPPCGGVMAQVGDCKRDALPKVGLLATAWVLAGGGTAALVASRQRHRAARRA